MKAQNRKGLMKQVAGIAGSVGAGVLLGFPAVAGTNYDRGVDIAGSIAATLQSPSVGMTKQRQSGKTIVNIAAGNPQFKTLTAALKAAGLIETLAGQGPFTVFAPTDAAFAKLPKGTLEKLLKPENKDKLVRVLAYHVVPGKVISTQLKTGSVNTVEGSTVNVRVAGGRVTVNNGRVTKANVFGSNGVIHIIDKVIVPKGVL